MSVCLELLYPSTPKGQGERIRRNPGEEGLKMDPETSAPSRACL